MAVLAVSQLSLISCMKETKNNNYSHELSVDNITKVVEDVMKWQVKEYPKMDNRRPNSKRRTDLTWHNGVFFYALAEWNEYKNNSDIVDWYEKRAADNYWSLGYGHSIYHADHLAISLFYAKLYVKYKDENIINPTRARLEFIANNPSTASLSRQDTNKYDRWTWCDALYMAPPVYAMYANILENKKLLEYMDKEYWETYSYLYDKEEKLFFRDSDYFDQRERNGEKIFWGRGNAWVTAGLCLLIPELPDSYKPKYIDLFVEMMSRIAPIQDEQGYWHASLLDTDSYPDPETSSTAYFTYSLWWGINNKILDEKRFLPYAVKGWEAMVNAVQPSGMLGWVQPIGQDPQHITSEMTETYGAAAFMLMGKEIIKYIENQKRENE